MLYRESLVEVIFLKFSIFYIFFLEISLPLLTKQHAEVKKSQLKINRVHAW